MTEATASLLIFVQLHALPTRTDGGLYNFYIGNSSNPFQNILLVCLASVLIAMVVVVWIALVCKRPWSAEVRFVCSGIKWWLM